MVRWTYTGSEAGKTGREYVLMDDVFGGLLASSDTVMADASFGNCRVDGVDNRDRGNLIVLALDQWHMHYDQHISVPAEGVYLSGDGKQELSVPADFGRNLSAAYRANIPRY